MKKVKEIIKKTFDTEVIYRIFQISNDGHIFEPKEYIGSDKYIFRHYCSNGYNTFEEAREAIRQYMIENNIYGKEYIILPIVVTMLTETTSKP